MANDRIQKLRELLDAKHEGLDDDTKENALSLYASMELQEIFTQQAEDGEIQLDFNGHWENGAALYNKEDYVKRLFTDFFLFRNSPDLPELLEAVKNKTPLNEFVELGRTMIAGECTNCASYLGLETNGVEFRLYGEDEKACPYPNGFPTVEVELNVPSGKLVAANDLRGLFPIAGGCGPYNVNNSVGIVKTIEAYANVGMMHGFVGNTCPAIWRDGTRRVTITAGTPDFEEWAMNKNEELEEIHNKLMKPWHSNYKKMRRAQDKIRKLEKDKAAEKEQIAQLQAVVDKSKELMDKASKREHKAVEKWLKDNGAELKARYDKMVPKGEQVGGICTDLWWYSIVDYDEMQRRYDYFGVEHGDSPTGKFEDHIGADIDIIDVEPGVYKLTHDMNARRKDEYPRTCEEPVHYATLDWVREPDPVVDYVQLERNSDFTAGQCLFYKMHKWKSLYMEVNRNPTGDVLKDSMNSRRLAYEEMTDQEKMRCTAAVAAQDMFSSRWDDWHPNGYCTEDPDMPVDTFDMPIPEFKDEPLFYEGSLRWSSLMESTGIKDKGWDLPAKAEYLNPSFQALAYNMLQNIIRYGVKLHNTSGTKGEPRTKEHENAAVRDNITLAKMCYRSLVAKYPETVPDYCEGLLESFADEKLPEPDEFFKREE